ncbi:MAG: hypothetical protein JW784_06455 [Candidatus Cloacimonetes bacterium]|nr:hypothetical protein [Candidatus Cloacimonadota bacterium]
MWQLSLSILCSALIGNLLILFKRDPRRDILLIFLGNYFLATIFSLATNEHSLSRIGSAELILGGLGGIFFLVNFLIYQKNITQNGLSLSAGMMRVSLIIPTFVSLVLFSEKIGSAAYLGIVTVLAAFIFLTNARSYQNFFWLVILFVITGVTDTILKLYDETGSQQPGLFMIILFAAAFSGNLILVFQKRRSFNLRYFIYGMILGIPNQMTTRFFLGALESVPAAVVYPLFAAGVVALCFLTDIFLWKKKYRIRERWGILMLIIGIILLNI